MLLMLHSCWLNLRCHHGELEPPQTDYLAVADVMTAYGLAVQYCSAPAAHIEKHQLAILAAYYRQIFYKISR